MDGVSVPCVVGAIAAGLGTLILTASHDKSLPIRVVTSKGHIAQLVTRSESRQKDICAPASRLSKRHRKLRPLTKGRRAS